MDGNLAGTSQERANHWDFKKLCFGHESRWSPVVMAKMSGNQRIKI
jgi:hypothetical protein